MPIRRITLTPGLNDFIETMVNTGEYSNASDVVSYALGLLKQKWDHERRKRKVLRAEIQAGVDALERGDFVDLEDAELDSRLARLSARTTTPD